MSPRIKKLIATLLIVLVWLPVYAMIFMAGLVPRILPHAAWYVSLLFYALAGTLWILPIGLALPWMYRGAVETRAMIDNVEQHRFELTENGLTVFASYRQHDNRYVIVLVEADPAMRGTGAAGRLMTGIVALAREKKLQIVPRCAYALDWFKNHPDAADVLE